MKIFKLLCLATFVLGMGHSAFADEIINFFEEGSPNSKFKKGFEFKVGASLPPNTEVISDYYYDEKDARVPIKVEHTYCFPSPARPNNRRGKKFVINTGDILILDGTDYSYQPQPEKWYRFHEARLSTVPEYYKNCITGTKPRISAILIPEPGKRSTQDLKKVNPFRRFLSLLMG